MPVANDLPLVTIVTPCLDRAAYVGDAISCVARQTYERIEHIVIDGGSTDGTQDALRDLEQRYDFTWISEPDSGMYNAINKGLALARGDILAYLNTDDLYLPWSVEVAVSTLGKDPDAGLAYGDMAIVDERTQGVALSLYPPFNLALLGRSAFLGQPTVFFRRSVFERLGGFDESLRYVADCDYWLRAGSAATTCKVDEIIAVQRDHADTLRSSQRIALEEEIRSVRSRYQPMGARSWLLRIVDRLYLFVDRRYRLLRFLRAARRHSRDPAYAGPWHRFLGEEDAFRISKAHILGGLIPFAGRTMLFRMGSARTRALAPLELGNSDR